MTAGLKTSGGEGGIRTLGTGVSPYNGLANRRIRPLCHLSGLGVTFLRYAVDLREETLSTRRTVGQRGKLNRRMPSTANTPSILLRYYTSEILGDQRCARVLTGGQTSIGEPQPRLGLRPPTSFPLKVLQNSYSL